MRKNDVSGFLFGKKFLQVFVRVSEVLFIWKRKGVNINGNLISSVGNKLQESKRMSNILEISEVDLMLDV